MSELIFPWHVTQWQQLWQLRQQTRLPHALLFSGIAGLGKKQFAKRLANALLCIEPSKTGEACGQCRTCLLIKAESHPDFLMVEPEESGQQIKIDQIRDVVAFVNETPLLGGYRVIIIHPANAMNINAANSLLKSLEEPSPRCLFILISDQSAKLLATLKSRCQKIQFQKPDHTQALSWLKESLKTHDIASEQVALALHLSSDAPLKAVELLEGNFFNQRQDLYQSLYALSQSKSDPLQIAARWYETDFRVTLGLFQSWLRDLLVYKLTQRDNDLLNVDYRDITLQLANKLSLKKLISFSTYLDKKNMIMTGPYNLNRQLVIEELFIEWLYYVSG